MLITAGTAVVVHKIGDPHDRESGRVAFVGSNAMCLVTFTDGRESIYDQKSLVPIGIDWDNSAEWAAGDAVILRDAYPSLGVAAGQIGRVVDVAPDGEYLMIRTRGSVGMVKGPVLADRVYRIPS